MEQFPSDLKRDKRLACTGRKCQQDTLFVCCDGFQYTLDCDVLVVSARMRTAFVFKRNGGETVAPCICFGKGHPPQLVRRWVLRHFAFCTRFHIDAVNALSISCVREADLKLLGVVLRLSDSGGQRLVPGFGFDGSKLGIAIDQYIVRGQSLASSAQTFEASWSDGIFSANATPFDDTPTRRGKRWIDVFGTGFGFVHGFALKEASLLPKRFYVGPEQRFSFVLKETTPSMAFS